MLSVLVASLASSHSHSIYVHIVSMPISIQAHGFICVPFGRPSRFCE